MHGKVTAVISRLLVHHEMSDYCLKRISRGTLEVYKNLQSKSSLLLDCKISFTHIQNVHVHTCGDFSPAEAVCLGSVTNIPPNICWVSCWSLVISAFS